MIFSVLLDAKQQQSSSSSRASADLASRKEPAPPTARPVRTNWCEPFSHNVRCTYKLVRTCRRSRSNKTSRRRQSTSIQQADGSESNHYSSYKERSTTPPKPRRTNSRSAPRAKPALLPSQLANSSFLVNCLQSCL